MTAEPTDPATYPPPAVPGDVLRDLRAATREDRHVNATDISSGRRRLNPAATVDQSGATRALALAVADPGAYLPRGLDGMEPVAAWQVRAVVLVALAVAEDAAAAGAPAPQLPTGTGAVVDARVHGSTQRVRLVRHPETGDGPDPAPWLHTPSGWYADNDLTDVMVRSHGIEDGAR